ncbi:MAG: right-handed parallel beta-helix repeat-containing protein [Candidatus Thermoplasmatota archaeon]|nr:right-handed parallel beta-helix repeat-containing protein [Candidatus Thermoplasmatota archaeon]
MRKSVIAVIIALAMVSVAIFAAIGASAGGSETGMFPNRIFEVSKSTLGSSDRAIYITSIQPTADCTWRVELIDLGGSAVEVTVHEIRENDQVKVSKSEVTEVGQLSEEVPLKEGFDYYATFRYIGKPGTSILAERVNGSIPVEYTLREPISIASDDEFTEENGVIGGSGTEGDPYVISGWEIYSTTTHCIQIYGTNAQFVIRDCFLHGDLEGDDNYYHGICNIKITYCTYAAIERVTAVRNDIGLNIESSSDVQVSASDFSGNWYGVHSRNTPGLTIGGSTACECKYVGIYIGEASYFSVVDCNLNSNRQQGIIVYSSGFGVISDNIVADNGEAGVLLLDCGMEIEMYRNSMDSDGVYLLNCGPECYDTLTLDESNTVNGLPVKFYKHESGLLVEDIAAGQIIIALCDDVTVRGLTLSDCDVGIAVAYSSTCFIMDCVFSDNDYYGVNAVHSDLVNISFCQASSNAAAVGVRDCTDLHLSMNVFTGSSNDAVSIANSYGGTIMSCQLRDSNIGLGMFGGSDFTIAFNQISNNEAIGANLDSTSECLIYHNDFIGFGTLAQDNGYNNRWDNGYPVGGNYWANYLGIDEDGDGIGDEPRTVPQNGVDMYPLMEPCFGTTPTPYTLRSPIVISGDDDFTEQNGVVSGDGTWSSPYLISGWEIELSGNQANACIRIEHTTAIFVIMDCYVHDTYDESVVRSGISLYDVGPATIKHVLAERCAPAIHVSQCQMLSVDECVINDCAGGVRLFEVTGGSSVWGCTIADVPLLPIGIGGTGVSVWNCENLSVGNNVVRNAGSIGLFAAESNEVRFSQNSISQCVREGIRLQDNMTNCEITGNSISDCGNGVSLWVNSYYYSPDGVTFYLCDWYSMDSIFIGWNDITGCAGPAIGTVVSTERDTPITGLTVTGNQIWDNPGSAILLEKVGSSEVLLNELNTNGAGVVLYWCGNVKVYHNNIMHNSIQAYDDGDNLWDDGYPSGGNYWSDYEGIDANMDGIGDTPYLFDAGAQDSYPLMTPY